MRKSQTSGAAYPKPISPHKFDSSRVILEKQTSTKPLCSILTQECRACMLLRGTMRGDALAALGRVGE